MTVSQAGESRTVQVSVRNEEIRAIEISPSLLVVPVDHDHEVRVYGQLAEWKTNSNWPPIPCTAEAVPSPLYADYDPRQVELTGRAPTTARVAAVARPSVGQSDRHRPGRGRGCSACDSN